MKRRIEQTNTRITPLTVSEADAAAWLRQEMAARALPILLAHADDGVVWGRLEGDALLTAHDAFRDDPAYRHVAPPLRAATLQQARAFGPRAELMLWRDGDGAFHARLIEDGLPPTAPRALAREHLDEAQMLWGTTPLPVTPRGFTLWREGAQGMLHAIPCENEGHPPILQVRHYLAADATARIELSRLCGLSTAPPEMRMPQTQQHEEDL